MLDPDPDQMNTGTDPKQCFERSKKFSNMRFCFKQQAEATAPGTAAQRQT